MIENIKIKKLSLDFDGTISTSFDAKNILNLATRSNIPITDRFKFIDIFFTFIGSFLQKPKHNVEYFLQNIKNIELVVTTGRPEYIKKETDFWLKKHNLAKYFTETYYLKVGDSPTNHKLNILSTKNLDGHIDDNPAVINELAKRFPEKVFILLNKNSKNLQNKKLPNAIHAKNWNEALKIIKDINKN